MHRDDERLGEISKLVLGDVDARFAPFKEFKITWSNRRGLMELRISDYLAGAPEPVLISLMGTISNMIARKPFVYEEEYTEWVTSDEFPLRNRETYLRRSKNLSRTPAGKVYNIVDSVDRLLDMGLLKPADIDNSFFSWTVRPNVGRIGFCSTMMKVVGISSALDDPSTPEYVLDYVVYHESLHLRQGYRPQKRAHDSDFRREERAFPRYREAERCLRGLRDKV